MRFFLTGAFVAVVLPAQVPYTRIVNANKEPQNWLTYSRTYNGQRYSPLAQITPANIARLKPLWTPRSGQCRAMDSAAGLQARSASWFFNRCFLSPISSHPAKYP